MFNELTLIIFNIICKTVDHELAQAHDLNLNLFAVSNNNVIQIIKCVTPESTTVAKRLYRHFDDYIFSSFVKFRHTHELVVSDVSRCSSRFSVI